VVEETIHIGKGDGKKKKDVLTEQSKEQLQTFQTVTEEISPDNEEWWEKAIASQRVY